MFASLYTAHISKNQGFDNPAPIADIEGWTVWKQQQTEIYVIQHNMGLTDPLRQLHVVATPMESNTVLVIESMESNQFTISTWLPNGGSKSSAFMFIAARSS